MRHDRYLDSPRSDDDIANAGFRAHLGGGADTWEDRGAFRLARLRPSAFARKIAWSTAGAARSGAMRHCIRDLAPGCHNRFDENRDFVRAAHKIVDDAPDLADKAPVPRRAPAVLSDVPEFDVLPFCSVPISAGKHDWRTVLKLARTLPETAVIWIVHGRWIDGLTEDGKRGIDIARITGDDRPEALRAEINGWDRDNRMIPMIGPRRARTS